MKKRLMALLGLASMIAMASMASMAATKTPSPTEDALHSIVNVLLTPATDADTPVVEWKTIENIKGVNWRWPLNEIAQHSLEMRGTLGNDIEVQFKGSSTSISSLAVLIPADIDLLNTDIFNRDELESITVNCGEDHATAKLYLWKKPGYMALNLYHEKEFGEKAMVIINNNNPVGNMLYEFIYAVGCEIMPLGSEADNQ